MNSNKLPDVLSNDGFTGRSVATFTDEPFIMLCSFYSFVDLYLQNAM